MPSKATCLEAISRSLKEAGIRQMLYPTFSRPHGCPNLNRQAHASRGRTHLDQGLTWPLGGAGGCTDRCVCFGQRGRQASVPPTFRHYCHQAWAAARPIPCTLASGQDTGIPRAETSGLEDSRLGLPSRRTLTYNAERVPAKQPGALIPTGVRRMRQPARGASQSDQRLMQTPHKTSN